MTESATEAGVNQTGGNEASEGASAAQQVTSTAATPGGIDSRTRSDAARRRRTGFLLAACVSVAASSGVGFVLAGRAPSSVARAAAGAWQGKVARIARSASDGVGGVFVVGPSGKTPLDEGAVLAKGSRIATDERTRARLELGDGTVLVLDRATEVAFADEPRTVVVEDGAVLIDVPHVDGAPSARVRSALGTVEILGTKLAVTKTPDRMNVEVIRGVVEMVSADAEGRRHRVEAGQEGVAYPAGNVDIAPVNNLAQRTAFGEQLIVSETTHNEDAEEAVSGLGELRARKPGNTTEKDRAVRLTKHAVKIRIAGNVARTEIDEEFANDTDDVLEGIYRFPLPPGAQIERLALEVDGKLLDGEFLDKAKASAIWRGAIRNAAPQAPKPREEIVWVPGPWHDPALLEWSRGGRFELRVFPIPKRGSRRVVIAYTETVAPSSGVRRYVYPLPQGASSKLTIDRFSVDAAVRGNDGAIPVRARGYELTTRKDGDATALAATMTSFTPSGDLGIEYALDDAKSDATAWAYRTSDAPLRPQTDEAAATDKAAAKTAASQLEQDAAKGSFFAVALRPKLPRWTDVRPRDQVIVVDAGRSMFGERFARARRLAAQMTQEMDRRDRVTVLACDVSCKAMAGGMLAPGAPSANDVDGFLSGITPDGASDLVGAIRSAAQIGRDRSRDLRIVVLSDGVATAGYRSGKRVAVEAESALDDPRASIVAVPVGSDADVTLLGELARGGGGVVVPYQPGQRLEATALEVLGATYGTALRNVEVVLPPGLQQAAPATLAPIRAGSETIVTARMDGDAVKGDVLLRGTVSGEPFELKIPIDVRATSNEGNAFVPRLFAAARIADKERDATDAQKAELIALSRRFSVPSRFTSLLVLESEAMFDAFGIKRADHSVRWTGESEGQGYALGGGTAATGAASQMSDLAYDDEDGPANKQKAAESRGPVDVAGASRDVSAPAKRAAPSAPAALAPPAPSSAPRAEALGAAEDLPRASRRRPSGQFMRRIYVRRATITTDARPATSIDKVAQARAAVAAAPDERSKHKDLAKLLATSGQLDELGELLDKWSTRDPLDVDVIVSRADLAARTGDRAGSLRILGGALAASALTRDDAFVLASAIAKSYERIGRAEACSFLVTAGELHPADATAVARAVACERREGRPAAAERWMASMTDAQRAAVKTATAKIDAERAETAAGDFVVSARWSGDVDLDLAVVEPSGRRASAVGRGKGVKVEGALARDHETLSLTTSEAGSFAIEIVRADGETKGIPASGTLTIRAYGQRKEIPFTLTGARAEVGRVDARWEAELVPVDDDVTSPVTTVPGFDRAAAATALARVSVNHCAVAGMTGSGHVTVTFASTGRVTSADVDDERFRGTPAGRCVGAAFLSATIAPFRGPSGRAGTTFVLR